jgi:hypothetical protein
MPQVRAKHVAMAAVAVTTIMGGGPAAARAGRAPRGGLAPTLSGFPSSPRRERSLHVGASGMGIRFRSPASADVRALHTFWSRPTDGCEIDIAGDVIGHPASTIGSVSLPDGVRGWVAAPIDATLTGGEVYHLLLRCQRHSRSRLGYEIDGFSDAQRAGAWRLERLHKKRVRPGALRASPLFALAFADGRWWGQPYRAVRSRPLVRICGSREASVTLVPSRPLVVTGVRLSRRAGRAGVGFTLDARDGTTVLASPSVEVSALGRVPVASTGPVQLPAGEHYRLRLVSGRSHHCYRERALVTDLAVGPSLAGLEPDGLYLSRDAGQTWSETEPATLPVRLMGSDAPLASCGNGRLDPDEECDGAADAACPGRCSETCTCREPDPPATCGNGALDPGEECDGAADAACPGLCTDACTCGGGGTRPRPYRSIYASGYLGTYDPATIAVWPKRLGLMLGEANAQGPLIAPARALAAASGNGDARFIFYLSLTDMDSRCQCFDQQFYDGFRSAHPDWVLKDASGNPVSTSNGIGRLFATDVGNPAYVDAWASWALAAADKWGWDGTFVDNVFRGYFDSWSATPVNPRTGKLYTTAQYRADMLAAVRHLRHRFDADGKMLIGNHTSAWDPATFADPITRQEVLALGGVEIEDCIYDWSGQPHTEAEWIAQLQYLAFANGRSIRTVCSGAGSLAIGSPDKRDYLLASYLLTKEGSSSVSELNSLGDWWSGLAVDLGAPLGGYTCLDPTAGFAATNACPTAGKVYAREWQRGRVLVNPSGSATVTVPLKAAFLLGASRVTAVTLGPHEGAVLVHP